MADQILADEPASLDIREQIIRIDHMIIDMQRIAADRDRKRQEIYWEPWQVLGILLGGSAAFFAAGATFTKLFMNL
jgi:hypothetical protein